jgi:hypothetical protein
VPGLVRRLRERGESDESILLVLTSELGLSVAEAGAVMADSHERPVDVRDPTDLRARRAVPTMIGRLRLLAVPEETIRQSLVDDLGLTMAEADAAIADYDAHPDPA